MIGRALQEVKGIRMNVCFDTMSVYDLRTRMHNVAPKLLK